MRIGQGFFGLPQLAAQARGFINLISFFHSNYFTMLSAAKLPHPAHHRVGPLDVVFKLHAVSALLTRFDLLNGLHFKPMTVSNHLHSTRFFSFQSTNLFQDGTTLLIFEF